MNSYCFLFFSICLLRYESAEAKVLSPPFFNLAEGRKIVATATCGFNSNGPERFCFKSENTVREECDFCDPSDAEKSYPVEYAIDDMESWWQSPPLSRGQEYEKVNLTVSFGQAFTVGYVLIRPGKSSRPSLWVLEKSQDYGKTWSPWQYFAKSESDCLSHFGIPANQPIDKDDSVICSTMHFLLDSLDIQVPIISGRPSQKSFFSSPPLQAWATATDVRLRFLKMEDLPGISKSMNPEHYFYSIQDLKIGGRCHCNGHADSCEYLDSSASSIMECQCKDNTCGLHCDTCCPGFRHLWKPSAEFETFVCEA